MLKNDDHYKICIENVFSKFRPSEAEFVSVMRPQRSYILVACRSVQKCFLDSG